MRENYLSGNTEMRIYIVHRNLLCTNERASRTADAAKQKTISAENCQQSFPEEATRATADAHPKNANINIFPERNIHTVQTYTTIQVQKDRCANLLFETLAEKQRDARVAFAPGKTRRRRPRGRRLSSGLLFVKDQSCISGGC